MSDADLARFSLNQPKFSIDLATILGLLFGLGLIVGAIQGGDSDASFFNMPSVLIVLCGTILVTAVSFSMREVVNVGKILVRSAYSKKYVPSETAVKLVELSSITRKSGLLSLNKVEDELNKFPFLSNAIQMLSDGFSEEEIIDTMTNQIDALQDRHARGVSFLRRGSEIAPAMGLIGTLVGLVQMLSSLDDPDKIGPAMAVALLTTFYGAILGTIVLAPLAAKLERNSEEEVMVKEIVKAGVTAIARQENPRRVEMMMNAILSPADAIKVFD